MAKGAVKDIEDTEDITAEVKRLREEEGYTWAQISEALGAGQGKVMLAYLTANVAPKDRIKGKSDEDYATKIVAARDELKLSWGQISARSGLPEGRCRKLYEVATGQSTKGNRIGKGGRYPSGLEPPKPEKAAKNGSGSKPAKAKKGKAAPVTAADEDPAGIPNPGNPERKLLVDMNEDELRTRLEGKTITVARGSKTEKISVKSVKGLKGEELSFSDVDGKQRAVRVIDIKKATR